MRREVTTVQYTIRGVSPKVDRVLRKKAALRKQSLNQVILDELTMATLERKQRADFSDLVGRWTPDLAFDETSPPSAKSIGKSGNKSRPRHESPHGLVSR